MLFTHVLSWSDQEIRKNWLLLEFGTKKRHNKIWQRIMIRVTSYVNSNILQYALEGTYVLLRALVPYGLLPFFRIWGSSYSEVSLNCRVSKVPISFLAIYGSSFSGIGFFSFWYCISYFWSQQNFKNKFLDQNCLLNRLMIFKLFFLTLSWSKLGFWLKKNRENLARF